MISSLYRRNFKFFIVILLILLGLFVLANFNKTEIFLGDKFKQYFTYSSCDKPVTYKLGSLDPRFGLTKEEFLKDTKEASRIWEKAYGKKLLSDDSTGKKTLIINLI